MSKPQEFVKVDTRIRRTIKALRSILNEPLIYNREIPVQQEEVVILPGKPFTSTLKLKEILQNSYTNLSTTYNATLKDLNIVRKLMYIFIVATVIMIGIATLLGIVVYKRKNADQRAA